MSMVVNPPSGTVSAVTERERVVVHVDLDAFFASVEIRDDPRLRGRPVVVGGSSTRGVVLAASYEARRWGIRSAQPMAWAVRSCPDLVVIRPRMRAYSEASDAFFRILDRYSPLVEGLSADEAFLDLTGTERLWGSPDEAVARLRADVRREVGLAASAGIAPVKFVAKIVTDLAKPDGQRRVRAEDVAGVLDPLPVGRLWGVGPKTEARLAAASIRTVAQLRQAPAWVLQRALGSESEHLTRLARGIDPRPVVPDREARSVGAEDTFESDVTDLERIETSLLHQSERVATRLRRAGLVAAGVVLKYKTYDFKRLSRQAPLPAPSSDGTALFNGVRELLHLHPPPAPLRLCGVGTYGLGSPGGPELFETDTSRREQANAALDAIRSRFGDGALVRARLLGHRSRDRSE